MGWILLTVVAIVLFAVLLRFRARMTRSSQDVVRRQDQEYRVSPSFVTIALVGLVLAWVIFTGSRVLNVVDNGHVGLVYTFGAITGHHGDGHGGLVVTAPWQTLEQANVQVQALQPPSSCYNNRYRGCMEAFTSETQDVFISATVNVHVDPENIQALYRSVGPDYVTKLILPRVAQITKEEAVKYGAAEIAPRREELRKTIASRLTNELEADR